jgi:hypothetical protein
VSLEDYRDITDTEITLAGVIILERSLTDIYG